MYSHGISGNGKPVTPLVVQRSLHNKYILTVWNDDATSPVVLNTPNEKALCPLGGVGLELLELVVSPNDTILITHGNRCAALSDPPGIYHASMAKGGKGGPSGSSAISYLVSQLASTATRSHSPVSRRCSTARKVSPCLTLFRGCPVI